ncbi:hypothetical protein EVAR_75411_1 [Eumeta japonica]|uniref:Uncharacterized protein n=1 Tax=Eumeta variegata TaxID=151549 RepID=A0A4C1TMH2_EUMVA|nr:hypothetical protein EVAR_75411_1 [Eumeta japonica]
MRCSHAASAGAVSSKSASGTHVRAHLTTRPMAVEIARSSRVQARRLGEEIRARRRRDISISADAVIGARQRATPNKNEYLPCKSADLLQEHADEKTFDGCQTILKNSR